MARKIQRVTVTVDVEMEDRKAMPPRRNLAAAVIEHLKGGQISVATTDSYGGWKEVDVRVIGAYSKLAEDEAGRMAPDLKELRAQ